MRELTDDEQEMAYRFAHIALPADASACDPWEWRGDDEYRRYFLTQEWDVAGLWVSVAGEQNQCGQVTRWMHVGGEDQCSTSDRTALILALQQAGALFDSLSAGEHFADVRREYPDATQPPRTN